MSFVRAALLAALLFAGFAGRAGVARGADHRDDPRAAAFPAGDIADLYLFHSPADTSKLVLALDVNPRAPGDARTSYFSSNVVYVVHVVTCRATLASLTTLTPDQDIQVTFAGSGVTQTFSLSGLTTTPITGTVKSVVTAAGGAIKVYCGPRDDPFFFDRDAYSAWVAKPFPVSAGNGLRRPGDPSLPPPPHDTFEGWDVASIVAEFPATDLAQCKSSLGILKLWAETKNVHGTTSKPSLRKLVR
jgi:hypothetical protein